MTSKKEYNELLIELVSDDYYPCKSCGKPVRDGYRCTFCGDTDPHPEDEE